MIENSNFDQQPEILVNTWKLKIKLSQYKKLIVETIL